MAPLASRWVAALALVAVAMGFTVHGGAPLKAKPNILYILLDDFGWGDAGWHWRDGFSPTGLATPEMTALAKEGVELDRHYAFQACSPTRAAIQSGRNPIHVNVLNIEYFYYNPKDNVSGFAGIPRPMTGIAELLRDAGYATHMYGKWDAGMATPEHLPHGRGYESSVAFWSHGNNYWSYVGPCSGTMDLWRDNHAASDVLADLNIKTAGCAQDKQTGCTYEEEIFEHHVHAAIRKSVADGIPFFIFWAPHLVHDPYMVPDEYLKKYTHISDQTRQKYYAMVTYLDKEVGRVVQHLKDKNVYDNTLIVVHSDNGGDISGGRANDHGANNYPLRGGKGSNWEGGIRVAAFVSGGCIPSAMRGKKLLGLSAVWDWYATLAAVAGIDDIKDTRAEEAQLPGVDSVNLWPMLSGEVAASPRDSIIVGDAVNIGRPSEALVGGVIRKIGFDGTFKLLLGRLARAVVTSPEGPNATQRAEVRDHVQFCGAMPETGCLYNLDEDPSESTNMAAVNPTLFQILLDEATAYQETVFNPDRGELHKELVCNQATQLNEGFVGPFVFAAVGPTKHI